MWAGEPQDARVGKLKELRLEMWKRMHIPVPDQWRWLSAALRGHYGYYGLTGTAVLAAEDENKRARIAAEILESEAYGSTAARVAAFVAKGGGCRATFFNYRRYLVK